MPPTIDIKLCLCNEANILGHAEARTRERRVAAERLVELGLLAPGGTMSHPRGAKWYKRVGVGTGRALPASPRVEFVHGDSLGASTADDLTRCVADVYRTGDEGRLAFQHPNPKLAAEGWVYVEVDGKSDPSRKLYVGVPVAWVEAVAPSGADELSDTAWSNPRAVARALAAAVPPGACVGLVHELGNILVPLGHAIKRGDAALAARCVARLWTLAEALRERAAEKGG